MNIKGTAVRALLQFIEEKYPDYYDQWLSRLPGDSKRYFFQTILPSQWYPLYETAVAPLEVLASVLDVKKEDLAFEVGRYSARVALTGVYKFFASLAKPTYIIKRGSIMFKTYYDPAEVDYEVLGVNEVMFMFGRHQEKETLIYHRVRGWIFELTFITQKVEPTVEFSVIDHMNGFYSGKFIVKW